MKAKRLTLAQALIQSLNKQYSRVDGKNVRFVEGVSGIFGHGCVVDKQRCFRIGNRKQFEAVYL